MERETHKLLCMSLPLLRPFHGGPSHMLPPIARLRSARRFAPKVSASALSLLATRRCAPPVCEPHEFPLIPRRPLDTRRLTASIAPLRFLAASAPWCVHLLTRDCSSRRTFCAFCPARVFLSSFPGLHRAEPRPKAQPPPVARSSPL
ncbi:hypothetical protein TRVL_04981 [Trypanosoma vivax]|nr:hypothetical protein TRVL_04981 [Trypanosoma vivax]